MDCELGVGICFACLYFICETKETGTKEKISKIKHKQKIIYIYILNFKKLKKRMYSTALSKVLLYLFVHHMQFTLKCPKAEP